MHNYDVVVVGGGPGGYVAAIRAASGGLKTALIEREALGGVCLNWGCIPTKALLRNAEIISNLREGTIFGFRADNISTDYSVAQRRSRQVSARLCKGIQHLMSKNKVDVYQDSAKLAGGSSVILENSGRTLVAKNLVLAPGSHPAQLPHLDYSREWVLDSKKALQLTKLPDSIVIIGAGAIGMEFATIFSAYGVKVALVEMAKTVLPLEDADVSTAMAGWYRETGVEIHTSATVKRVTHQDGLATVVAEEAGKTIELRAELVLAAAGIQPNSAGLGIENCGIETCARGFIKTDERMRTNVKNVYAIGDVTGKLALAHVASAQAIQAVDDILGRTTAPLEYDHMPRCTYTNPEAASVGLTEAKAKEAGYAAASVSFPLAANGKALAYGDTRGFAKLVYDAKYGQLLGASLCGVHATEMIWGIAGYLGVEMDVDEMRRVVHPHPSVSETIWEAACMAAGEGLHI